MGGSRSRRWNRVVVQVDDIEAAVGAMKDAGVRFRNDVVTGPGGKQVLIDDPSWNPIELFQPHNCAMSRSLIVWEVRGGFRPQGVGRPPGGAFRVRAFPCESCMRTRPV